jgi:uncharacterized LabA/DUF88 family protein
VVIDWDNLVINLRIKGFFLNNLKTFIPNFLEAHDELVKFKNREGKIFNPVVCIVGMNKNKVTRKKQIEKLNEIKFRCRNLVEVIGIEPKVSVRGRAQSRADLIIASIIGAALSDNDVEKIIVVSGDGDFLYPLELIGLAEKEIGMVAIKGSVSGELMDFVTSHGGNVEIIEKKIPGILEIEKKDTSQKKERQASRYFYQHLKNDWNKTKMIY